MSNYRLNKVSTHEFGIQRKRWVATDSNVSYWHDEFHSLSTAPINWANNGRSGKQYGVSSKEIKVSKPWLVTPLRPEVFGG